MLNDAAIVKYFRKTGYALTEKGSESLKYNAEISILCSLFIHLS